MSISSLNSQIAGFNRDIHNMTRQLHAIEARAISKRKEIAVLMDKIAGEKDFKRVVFYNKDLIAKQQQLSGIDREKLNKSRMINDKERRRNEATHKRSQEESKEAERVRHQQLAALKLQQDLSKQLKRNSSEMSEIKSIVHSSVMPTRLYDIFLSHASEDKVFVNGLVIALEALGLKVWYDSSIMKIGMSLRRTIDNGLSNSRFGIVVLSPNFFGKEWPQKELDALFTLESNGNSIILPLWHEITKDEIGKHSRLLMDKIALNTAVYTTQELAMKIHEVVNVQA